ncbi:MAG: hypothetical protein ACJ0P6_02030 [Flavobacteriaceae bacterium]
MALLQMMLHYHLLSLQVKPQHVDASNLLVWAQGDDAIDIDQAYSGTIDNVVVHLGDISAKRRQRQGFFILFYNYFMGGVEGAFS